MLAIKPRNRTIHRSAHAKMARKALTKQLKIPVHSLDYTRLLVIDADKGAFHVFKGRVVAKADITTVRTLDKMRDYYDGVGARIIYQRGSADPCADKKPTKKRRTRKKRATS